MMGLGLMIPQAGDGRGQYGAPPYRFATNRTKSPFGVSVVVGGGDEYQASQDTFYTPDYIQTDLRVCIPNYYTPPASNPPFEVALDATRLIEGVALKIGSTFYQFTFSGVASHTFATDPYVWSDPLSNISIPANTLINIIVCDYTPIGLRRPKSYDPILGKYGDGYSVGATTQSAYLTSGTVPAPALTGPTNTGPSAIIARGAPLSQPVPLVVGMSITDGTATNAANQLGARANSGYVPAGFDDDTAVVGRFPIGMFAVGATGWQTLTTTNFAIRAALLAEVGYPFNVIYCEYGQNDTDAGISLLELRANVGWAFLKTLGTPARRVVQGGINPLTSDATTNIWTVPALTTVSANNAKPSGVRWAYQDYCATLPNNVDAYVNLTSYFVDATLTDRWITMGRNSVLTSNVSSGFVITVTGTVPIVGDDIVIGAGVVGAIVRNVGAVAANGGNWDVTFTTGEPAVGALFLAGAAVKATATRDGIHPTGALHAQIAPGLIAAKSAGTFSGSSKQPVPVPVIIPTDIPNLVAWFEPGRGGMFQSNAGSGAAPTANTDPVGYLPNLGGDGIATISLANNTTRPLLAGVGAKPYVVFDKSLSTILTRVALGAYAAPGASWFACLASTAGAVSNYFAGERDSGGANSIYSIFNMLNATDTSGFIRNSVGGILLTNGTTISTNAFPTNSTIVVVGFVDDGATITPYINGVAGSATSYTRAGSLTQNRFGLGGLWAAAPGSYMSMNLYGATFYNRALTALEAASLFLYLDGLH